jgi:hypothetical protein
VYELRPHTTNRSRNATASPPPSSVFKRDSASLDNPPAISRLEHRHLAGRITRQDLSQTNTLPGVEPAPLEPPRAPIEGDSHAALRALRAPLEALAGGLGYTVAYCELEQVEGLCDYRARRISVAARLAPNGQVAVLVHELAHALVGREAGLSRPLEELVVEAVAYVVCAGAGLDTSPDSVPYIAGWAGDDAVEQLQKAAELIDGLARRIEQAIAPADDADQELTLGEAA